MRFDLLERAVRALTVLSVVCVAAIVALLSAAPPPTSGIPRVAEVSALATQDWLAARRGRPLRAPLPPLARPPARPTASSAPATEPAPATEAPPVTTTWFEPRGDVPPAEQAHVPWLRRVPGVAYLPPARIPAIVSERYRSWGEAWTLVQEGSGRFEAGPDGTPAYVITTLDPRSLLATRVGLRPGDRLLSINGLPVPDGPAGGRALFEALRDARRVALLVLRDGVPTVLAFEVD